MTPSLLLSPLLPPLAWHSVLACLAPHDLANVGAACHALSHVTDSHNAATALAALLVPRQLDGLTCDLYAACEPIPPNEELLRRWTRLLLTDTTVPAAVDGDNKVDRHFRHNPIVQLILDETEMSARQIVPQAPEAMRPPKHDALTTATPSTTSLAKLMERFTRLRRRRPTHQLQQRNSWPTVRPRESLARRAHESLASAWHALHRDASLLAPPAFLLRTQRRLSQSFNLKIVQAVSRDVRRSESYRRSSLTMLDTSTSLSSASSDDMEFDDAPLRMRERLSLTLGRRLSRDAPMLTEGSALECRVREVVYSLLRNPSTLEGHVAATFFAKQEEFTSTRATACQYYLGRVRETVADLVQFIIAYRMRNLADEWRGFLEEDESDEAFWAALEHAVQRAVEEYFCFSLRYELRQWSVGASNVDRRSRAKTLALWRALPPTSRAFGFKRCDPELASQPLIAEAISKLAALETIVTPSLKMENVLRACHALSEWIAQGQATAPLSPSARVCLGDADAFLPLLIFALSRSGLRDAFAQSALLHGLFPFASQHGERMYYLTMVDAALEFMRTTSTSD